MSPGLSTNGFAGEPPTASDFCVLPIMAGHNMTSLAVPGVTETMTYDAESRMTSWDGTSVTLSYDGLGRRVTKTTSGGTTVYVMRWGGRGWEPSGAEMGSVFQSLNLLSSRARHTLYSWPITAQLRAWACATMEFLHVFRPVYHI